MICLHQKEGEKFSIIWGGILAFLVINGFLWGSFKVFIKNFKKIQIINDLFFVQNHWAHCVVRKCFKKKNWYFKMNEEIINAQEPRSVRRLPNIESLTHKLKTSTREDTMNMVTGILLDVALCWKSSCTCEKINQKPSISF